MKLKIIKKIFNIFDSNSEVDEFQVKIGDKILTLKYDKRLKGILDDTVYLELDDIKNNRGVVDNK